jgi:predicted nuclease of predicted toxin-antitoxin system
MKLKFDENFSVRLRQLFLDAGHDVETVHSEGLQGQQDERIYEVCCNEKRCLLTSDRDFADVFSFPPVPTGGIVVFRAPNNRFSLLQILAHQLLQMLAQRSVVGELWIVEPGRIRVYPMTNGDQGTPIEG